MPEDTPTSEDAEMAVDEPGAGSITPSDPPPAPPPDVLAQPDPLAAPPGEDADLLDRVATALGDVFEDSLGTTEDGMD